VKGLHLPDSGAPRDGARLSAPSALRNAGPILAVLSEVAPARGRALELAAGTGEHAVRFADALPGLLWLPTDVDLDRLESIAAHAADAGVPTLLPPMHLDASVPGWSTLGPFDLILCVNLLHLIPAPAAETVLAEAAHALAPGGVFVLYGPFLREGVATSAGDAAFDASLRAQDPAIGYKVLGWVTARLAPLAVAQRDMPANNVILLARA
jgi:SAM-dependent methyltransferase